MIEPVIPPSRVARGTIPKIICIRREARLREQRDIQVEGACLGNGGCRI